MLKTIKLIGLTLLAALPAGALALPVVPGSVGFGVDTAAGRDGRLVRVTNLNDSGAGSLRACVEASGPRICVFEVSGTIRIKSILTAHNPYLTIAGQTAPAPGIMLRGASLSIRTSNVLVQHIAVRPGDDLSGPNLHMRDSVKIIGQDDQPVRNVVIDHCSLSWAIDETVEVWGNNWDNVTLSNNIISEPLRDAPEEAGYDQGYGVLIDATRGRVALIGNLFAHVHNRNPRSAAENFVFVNNVVYNPGIIQANLYNKYGIASKNTIVGNVFINGHDTTFKKPVLLNGLGVNGKPNSMISGSSVFLADNKASVATSDPWSIVQNNSDVPLNLLKVLSIPVWPSGLDALVTNDDGVVEHVLKNVGARPGQRSAVDQRIVEDVRNGTGRIINCVAPNGTARCNKNAGGWPQLAHNTRRLELPDNPNGDSDEDGYTNAEEWLQAFAAVVEGSDAAEPLPGPGQPAAPTSLPNPPTINSQ